MLKLKNGFFASFFVAFGIILTWGLQVISAQADLSKPEAGYSHLLDFIGEDSLEGPLHPFAEFEPVFDVQSHQANLAYFRRNPQIIRKIKKDLNAGQICWRLEAQKQRLLFVPEKRETYERLYEAYCKELVAHVLEKTDFRNPFKRIVSLHEAKPEIPSDGVTAFLIHNLAKESVSKYIFSDENREKTSVMRLKGTEFVGQVGAYTTNIYPSDDGTYKFVRDRFTIWQNTAENPYTALMVPAEETLHILLREYTEGAIKKDLMQKRSSKDKNIRAIAHDWLAVEEAIVGGLVYAIVPSFLSEVTEEAPLSQINQDLKTKKTYPKYCYLEEGIELVSDIGIDKAIDMYAKNPSNVKNELAQYSAEIQGLAVRGAQAD